MAPEREYPAWFTRIYAKTTDPNAKDFDEDISEIGDGEPPEYEFDGDTVDEKYDYYFSFITQREARKVELQQIKEGKASQLELEEGKKAQVQAAYEAMADADDDDLAIDPEVFYGKLFNLYSPEFVQWTYDHYQLVGASQGFLELRVPDPDEPVANGNLILNEYNMSAHEGHELQSSAGTTEHRISLGPNEGLKNEDLEINLTEDAGEWDFGLVIIGEDNVLVRVSREFVFRALSVEPPADAPEVFEFWGISQETDG